MKGAQAGRGLPAGVDHLVDRTPSIGLVVLQQTVDQRLAAYLFSDSPLPIR